MSDEKDHTTRDNQDDAETYEPAPEPQRIPIQGEGGQAPEQDVAEEEETADAIDRTELDALRARAQEYDALEDRLKRVAADFANTQKRIGREARTRIDYAIQDFTLEILPVTDSLHRALNTAEESHDLDGFIEGIRLVDKQFQDILARHGVEPITVRIGETFDPEFHDVLAVVPTYDHPENAIIEIVERGFRIKDRVLRPARVLVAKPPPEPAQ